MSKLNEITIVAICAAIASPIIILLGFLLPSTSLVIIIVAGLLILAAAIVLLLAARDSARLGVVQQELDLLKKRSIETQVNERSYKEHNQLVNKELTGELGLAIKSAVKISAEAIRTKIQVRSFADDFTSAAGSFETLDQSVSELQVHIRTTASSTEQTSAAVEQISANIRRISEESASRSKEIVGLVDLSRRGQTEMKRTMDTYHQITASIGDLNGFIALIEDIAERTSLLAMNAAIEAAHAGDLGRGFAVVADEVRKLAESSSSNANSISSRLKTLITVIHNAEKSSRITSDILSQTEEKVKIASDSFIEIEQGSKELAVGGNEILSAVIDLRESSVAMRDQVDHVVDAYGSIKERISHLENESTSISKEIDTISDNAREVNMNSLALSQGMVSQIKAGLGITADTLTGKALTEIAGLITLQHLAWTSRMRAVLDGSIVVKAEELSDHTACDLGKWIEKNGRVQFGKLPDFIRLEEEHKRMHATVRSIAGLKSSGKLLEAESAFSTMCNHSDVIIELINTLAKDSASREFIVWGPTLMLGDPEIDGQHQELVNLINKLSRTIDAGQSRQILGSVLDELINYTSYHFTLEEKRFMSGSYPDKQAHLAQHKDLVRQVMELHDGFQNGTAILGSEVLQFLKNWIIKHIEGTDRGYVGFI